MTTETNDIYCIYTVGYIPLNPFTGIGTQTFPFRIFLLYNEISPSCI